MQIYVQYFIDGQPFGDCILVDHIPYIGEIVSGRKVVYVNCRRELAEEAIPTWLVYLGEIQP